MSRMNRKLIKLINEFNDLENVKKLVKKNGIDYFYDTPDGDTALHIVCNLQKFEIIKYLVEEEGANLNILSKKKEKYTPFYVACRSSSGSDCKYINDNDVRKYNDGKISENDYRMIYKKTSEKGRKDNEEIIRYLVSKGANLNIPNRYGIYPIHIATDKNIYMAKILFELGADPNVQNNNGKTPLHFAGSINHKLMIELLLKNEVNPILKDKKGKVPNI